MKKIISFILGFLILLNTFGFNMVFIFMLQETKTENFEIIDKHPGSITAEDMIVLNSSRDNIEIVNSREIRFENEMYDIVSKKMVGADCYYYCLRDKKDTKLHIAFSSLNDLNDKASRTPANLANTILKNLLKNYLPFSHTTLIANYKSLQLIVSENFLIPDIIIKPNFPPPQVVIFS
jgi:hypothetical protein